MGTTVRCLDRAVMRGPLQRVGGAQLSLADMAADVNGTDAWVARIRDRGCDLSLAWPSARTGLRVVNGVYQVPHEGTLRVAWTSTNAGELRLNGRAVSSRAFSAGPGATMNVASVTTSPGRLELEVRAWMGAASDSVSAFAFIDDAPLIALDPDVEKIVDHA